MNSVVSLINSTIQPVVVSQLILSGDAFSVDRNFKLPLTVDAASTFAVNVHFNPKATGDATGLLTLTSNYQTSTQRSVKLHGKGTTNGPNIATALSALTCSTLSFAGAGTENCTATLNAAAPSGGFVVSLSSSNLAVSVPTSVTVSAGATSAGFTAAVSAVTTSQTAVITANAGGVTRTFSVQLNAAVSGPSTSASTTLSALYCSSGTMTGSGTDLCTVTLTAPAPSGGLSVSLSSNSSAVTVPGTVMVPANATSVGFAATVASVATAQAVIMTASASGVTKSFTLQLNAAIIALSINATNVSFGQVVVNTSATQSVTLSSTGTLPVTVGADTVTGAGFTVSGPSLPLALNPGQAVNLNVQFDPTTASTATGQLTVISNASTNGTAVIGLSGTGTTPPQLVAVTVTPTTVSTAAGTNQQFAASVTGTSNTTVTWAVSGTGCTGVSCGTISSSGLYTAPSTVPSPATVTITATSVSDSTKSASATATIVQSAGKTYYLAPAGAGGSDSNNGLTSGTPWLTPNHSLNCGDTILAAPGTYAVSNFVGTFGTVSCPAGNNVAWLTCAVFDGCKTSDPVYGIQVNKSYWGVQGWEVTVAAGASSGPCFDATPFPGTTTVHHIIFANDIANGCSGSGFYAGTYGGAAVDYLVLIGNIAYNSVQGSGSCTTALNIYEPGQSDSLPGTHMYVAGNFAYANIAPSMCGGTQPTDAEGIQFDTFDYYSYGGQTVADNNILLGNGGKGIGYGGNSPSTIYLRHNTTWGNEEQPNGMSTNECGEIALVNTTNSIATYNLTTTTAQHGCGGTNPLYAFWVSRSTDGTNSVDYNWSYSPWGYNNGTYSVSNFSWGSHNVFGTNPAFANAVLPPAPNCSGKANVPDCMSTVIANFTPTNVAAKSYGYQIPSGTPIYDPLFPQWLCTVNLPAGLVTMGCQTGP